MEAGTHTPEIEELLTPPDECTYCLNKEIVDLYQDEGGCTSRKDMDLIDFEKWERDQLAEGKIIRPTTYTLAGQDGRHENGKPEPRQTSLARAGRRAAPRVSALPRAPILHVEALDTSHVPKIRRYQDSLVCEGVGCDCDIEVFERGASSLE